MIFNVKYYKQEIEKLKGDNEKLEKDRNYRLKLENVYVTKMVGMNECLYTLGNYYAFNRKDEMINSSDIAQLLRAVAMFNQCNKYQEFEWEPFKKWLKINYNLELA